MHLVQLKTTKDKFWLGFPKVTFGLSQKTILFTTSFLFVYLTRLSWLSGQCYATRRKSSEIIVRDQNLQIHLADSFKDFARFTLSAVLMSEMDVRTPLQDCDSVLLIYRYQYQLNCKAISGLKNENTQDIYVIFEFFVMYKYVHTYVPLLYVHICMFIEYSHMYVRWSNIQDIK